MSKPDPTERRRLQGLDLMKVGKQFDLLFTDVIMPGGMNGPELAEKIRQALDDS